MVHAAVSASRSASRALVLTMTVALAAIVAPPPAATAAPPSNDSATAPDTFQSYTAENGTPSELQATAVPAEATPDFGVPRCLGPASFARTVWYVIPAESAPHEIAVEASGRTLDVVDLAAFVQPQDAPGAVRAEPPVPQEAGVLRFGSCRHGRRGRRLDGAAGSRRRASRTS